MLEDAGMHESVPHPTTPKDNILPFQSQLTLRANEMRRAKGQLLQGDHRNLAGLHSVHPGIQRVLQKERKS